MNKLVILDDDLNFARNLFNQISTKLNNTKITNILSDGKEFIDNIKNYYDTDILLLDLEMPNLNGIKLLNIIKDSKHYPTYIIIVSGNAELILKSKEYIGYIYKIFQKPIDIDSLVKALSIIETQSKDLDLQYKIYKELSKFNFNRKRIGYTYILDAIKIVLDDEETLKNLRKSVYPVISKKHKEINNLKVKWAIEQCIDDLYKTTNINILNSYFYIDNCDKLTSKQFISIVAENIKLKCNLEDKEKNYYKTT